MNVLFLIYMLTLVHHKEVFINPSPQVVRRSGSNALLSRSMWLSLFALEESSAALFGSRQSCTDGDANTKGRKPRWQAPKVDRDHTRTKPKAHLSRRGRIQKGPSGSSPTGLWVCGLGRRSAEETGSSLTGLWVCGLSSLTAEPHKTNEGKSSCRQPLPLRNADEAGPTNTPKGTASRQHRL